jgi:hypothetical protein
VPDEEKQVWYKTSDIYFASFLCALDVPLQASEWETLSRDGRPDKKLVWVFKIPEGAIGKLRAAYFSGNGTVKARKFADSLKSLKQMCYV